MPIVPAIAIDYGTKKSWLAYSVETFAFAWKTVETKNLLGLLPKFIQEKKAQTVIIGMPYNIDGTMSAHGKRVEKWAEKLKWIIHIPVVLIILLHIEYFINVFFGPIFVFQFFGGNQIYNCTIFLCRNHKIFPFEKTCYT